MTAIRHHGLVGVFVLALVALPLAAPASVAGCSCQGTDTGAVIFTGTVTDVQGTSNRNPSGIVVAFDIEEVTRGDPGDGRVFTPSYSGACGRDFQLGALYRVHARADAVGPYHARPPDVPLVTGLCMASEHLGVGNLVVAAPALASSPPGIAFMVVAAVITATTLYVSRRRSARRDEPSG